MEDLVGTEWLAAQLGAPDLLVFDATKYLPNEPFDAKALFVEAHIPGAHYFDIDLVADPDASLPHMAPTAARFERLMGAMGVSNDHRVVFYDQKGLQSAARGWWLMRLFGHAKVAVLDGGLPKWLKEGRPVEDTPPMPRDRHFTARTNRILVRDLDQVRAALDRKREQVVDARSAGRFRGVDPEPRPGLRGGHMPGALNVPYTSLLDPETKTFLPAEELARVFRRAGVDLRRPIVTSCGSGVTACVVALGLYLLGRDDVAVYDGSWTEWGGRADTPVATG